MFPRFLPTARTFLGLTLLWFISSGVLAEAADAAEPAAASGGERLQSARWWREQASQHCATIDDAKARSIAYSSLAFDAGHADDLKSAATAAAQISDPLKGIYALSFVARQYHKQGNKTESAKLLETAQQLAERNERELTNFGHAHLVPALVELGTEAEARKYVDSIADPAQRKLASRELIAALATADLLDTDKTKLTELECFAVANAYAREGRIKETLAAAEHLTAAKERDCVYAALVDALVERKRSSEAEPVVERITSPMVKAEAQKRFLRTWGHGQPVEAIQARLTRASSRAEKVALYAELIPKLAADDRVDEAETGIKALVETIESSPNPVFVSEFGQFDDAVEIATQKSNCLLTAKSLARQGKQAAAQERIKWAEEPILALSQQAGLGKMMVVAGLIRTKIDMGDLAGARAALEAVDPPFRWMPATQLATAYAKTGDTATAIEMAHELNGDKKGRGVLYGDIAAVLIRRGDIEATQKLLAPLEATAEDAKAYLDVGKAMIEAGKTAELRKWLADMPAPIDRTFACIGAAEALQKAKSP